MTQSGKRPGAGKRKRSYSSRTEVANLAMDGGRTPLDIMLGQMNSYDSQAENLFPGVMHAAGRGDLDVATDLCDEIKHLWAHARAVAKIAAPYCHPLARNDSDDGKQANADPPGPRDLPKERLLEIASRYGHGLKKTEEYYSRLYSAPVGSPDEATEGADE